MALSSGFRRAGSNEFPFTIETAAGAVLGATVNPVMALAMYRAAQETHVQHQLVLKREGEVLHLN